MRSLLLGAAVALAVVSPALAQGWGGFKGQVVWSGPAQPASVKVNVDKDKDHCLAKGDLVKDELIVDAKTKGVKNVMVWLAPVGSGKIAVHPNLQAAPKSPLVIDQPMCLFEPRITMMRAGQELIVKNSAPVAHNARISGNADFNGVINLTIPPGQQLTKKLVAEPRPLMLACDIHGWMAGRIGVFDHPYFALTGDDGTFEIKDAPVGKYMLFVQHEKAGWLHKPRERAGDVGGSKGQPITIRAGGTVDLGKFELKPAFLDN